MWVEDVETGDWGGGGEVKEEEEEWDGGAEGTEVTFLTRNK